MCRRASLPALQVTSAPPAWTSTTLNIVAGKNEFIYLDVNATVGDVGDSIFYSANFSVNGVRAGYVVGTKTSLLPEGATQAFTGTAGFVVQEVYSYYRFFTGEQIIMSGSLEFPAPQFSTIVSNEPNQRAVVGGTGKWAGASGLSTFSRNLDGTYTHVIEILLPNRAAVQRV